MALSDRWTPWFAIPGSGSKEYDEREETGGLEDIERTEVRARFEVNEVAKGRTGVLVRRCAEIRDVGGDSIDGRDSGFIDIAFDLSVNRCSSVVRGGRSGFVRSGMRNRAWITERGTSSSSESSAWSSTRREMPVSDTGNGNTAAEGSRLFRRITSESSCWGGVGHLGSFASFRQTNA